MKVLEFTIVELVEAKFSVWGVSWWLLL